MTIRSFSMLLLACLWPFCCWGADTVETNFESCTISGVGALPQFGNRLTLHTTGLTATQAFGSVWSGGGDPCNPNFNQNGNGVVFEFDAPNTYTVIYEFDTLSGSGNSAYHPASAIVQDGAGVLYGTTFNGPGAIFKLSQSGGTWTYKELFSGLTNTAQGGLVIDTCVTPQSSSDQCIFGTTQSGGANNNGQIWEYDPTLGGTSAFSRLYSLQAVNGSGIYPDGKTLDSGLMESGGVLYGTAQIGGSHNGGVVFSFVPITNSYSVLYNFGAGSSDGNSPMSVPYIDGTGNMFGVTYGGGTANQGTVWEITSGGTYSSYSLTGTNGSQPAAELTSSGTALYGTTTVGGGSGCGTVFSFSSGTITKISDFGGGTNDGCGGIAPVFFVNSHAYTLTATGGNDDAGTIVQTQ